MAKEKTLATESFWVQLFQLKVYKKTQGRITRQVTFAAISVIFCLAAYRFDVNLAAYKFDTWLSGALGDVLSPATVRRLAAVAFAAFGVFVAYRLVNYTRFADFLISVEAEMNKVSWPARGELVRASIVVIVVMVVMAVSLWLYDLVWVKVLQILGIHV